MSLKNKKVKYTVSPSSLKGYREVYINYSHKGKDYKQLTYVKDNPKFKEKDYIRQAKKQFKPNFKVQAQPKAYFHFPVIPVVASLVIAGGLGTGGYFTYKYLTNPGGGGGDEPHYEPGTPVEVKSEINDPSGSGCNISLSKIEAVVGQKYETDITLTHNANEDARLPDKLDKVISNTTVLENTQYTYSFKSKDEAKLEINAEFVYGPIIVNLTVLPYTPEAKHTIYLDPCGGTITGPTEITDLDDNKPVPVEKKPVISRPGYDANQVKWYKDTSYQTEFKFGETPVLADYYLHAKWGDVRQYTVHFKDFDDGTTLSADQTIYYNEKIERPIEPTKVGSKFDNWYQKDGTTLFDFSAPLVDETTNEITAYGKFNLNDCHITYVTNGGTLGATHIDSVKYGKTITQAPDITRSGYDASLVTWWLDQEMTSQQFKFGESTAAGATEVKGDINLYAKWVEPIATKFNVYWVNYDGEILEKDEDVPTGTIPTYDSEVIPTKPTDSAYAYSFSGWSPEVTEVTDQDQIYVAKFDSFLLSNTYITFEIPDEGAYIGIEYIKEDIDEINVDWGDGSDPITTTSGNVSHAYVSGGTYTAAFSGNINAIDSGEMSSRFISTIYLGSTITYAYTGSFSYCENLSSIIIGSSLQTIQEYAFSYNNCLKSIKFIQNNSLKSIGACAFYSCPLLEIDSNTLPDNLESIGDRAFGDTKISEMYIGKTVLQIGDGVFSGCPLTSIKVDNENPNYKSDANDTALIRKADNVLLIGCSSTIPNYVTKINNSAMSGCRPNVTNVIIPDSVTCIGPKAFSYNDNLTEITIGKNVSDIEHVFLEGCTSLTSINVAEGNNTFDSRNNCNAIINSQSNVLVQGCKTSTIPNTVTTIGEYAFNESNISSITIPNSVVAIEERAFAFTAISNITFEEGGSKLDIGKQAFVACKNITSVVLPSHLTSFADYAFGDCVNILTFDLSKINRVVTVGASLFERCEQDFKIIVPSNLVEQYKSAGGWSRYAEHIIPA